MNEQIDTENNQTREAVCRMAGEADFGAALEHFGGAAAIYKQLNTWDVAAKQLAAQLLGRDVDTLGPINILARIIYPELSILDQRQDEIDIERDLHPHDDTHND